MPLTNNNAGAPGKFNFSLQCEIACRIRGTTCTIAQKGEVLCGNVCLKQCLQDKILSYKQIYLATLANGLHRWHVNEGTMRAQRGHTRTQKTLYDTQHVLDNTGNMMIPLHCIHHNLQMACQNGSPQIQWAASHLTAQLPSHPLLAHRQARPPLHAAAAAAA